MDPTTVIIMLSVHLVCSGGLLWGVSRHMPPRSGLGHWAAGAMLFGVAYLGRLATGLVATTPWAVVPDAAMLLAALLFNTGLREYVGRPPWPARVPGLLIGSFVALHFGVVAVYGAQGRHVLLNLSLGALYLALAALAQRSLAGQPPPVRVALATLLASIGTLGVMTFLRGLMIALLGPDHIYRGLHAQVYYGFASLTALLVALNLVWMAFVRLNAQLAELAARDPLTRVLNRNGLADAMQRHFASRSVVPLTLLQVDIDHFKRINDEHGHATGDAVLCRVAEALSTHVRAGDFVARTGGEEFLVGCAGGTVATAHDLGERLRAAVASLEVPCASGRGHVACTVSIGVSQAFDLHAGWERAAHQADDALYAAKSAGRDRVVRWEPAAA